MVLQDAAGSLNPRQTVYESVAEGIRLHRRAAGRREGRTEAGPGRRRAGRGRAAPAGAALPALPARAVRRAEAAGADRRRAGAAARSCCSPTSRSRRSTPRSAARSWRCCSGCARTSGMGVVVVTHDLGLAWNIADRIAVMYLGRVVECGTTEEVLESPAAPLHPGPAVGRAGDRAARAGRAHRRDPGPDPDPVRLPVPPALPGRSPTATAERPGVADACRTTPLDGAAGHRRPPRRLPPRRRAPAGVSRQRSAPPRPPAE